MIPAFLWGTTYTVTQLTLAEWPPLLLGLLRALPAGLLLLAIRPSLPSSRRQWKTLSLLGLVNIAAFFGFIFIMALRLPAAISGVGMVAVPVVAMLFHWIYRRELPNKHQCVCSVGLLVTAVWLFDPKALDLDWIGLVALLMALSCVVSGSMITQRLGQTMHWYSVLTWQLLLGSVFLSMVMCVDMLRTPAPYLNAVSNISISNVFGLIWLSMLNTAAAYTLLVWLLQRMSVIDFAFGGIANPLAGIAGGVLLLSEDYSLMQYGMMALMIGLSILPNTFERLKRGKLNQVSKTSKLQN